MKTDILKYCRLICCLLFLSTLVFSCIKDETVELPGDDSTATVNLLFDARAGATTDEQMAENEGIKEVRIIIADESNIVVFNELRSVDNSGMTLLYKFVIPDLPLGVSMKFYVIANEQSFGGAYGSSYAVGTPVTGLPDRVLTDRVPMRDIPDGLPMTGIYGPVSFDKGGHYDITIPIIRAVAKINLKIKNAGNGSIILNKIEFGYFITSRTKLFAAPGEGVVVDDGGYSGVSYPNVNVGLSADEEITLPPVYFCETAAASDAYTLELGGKGGFYKDTPKVFKHTNGDFIQKIDRNTSINLTATLNTWPIYMRGSDAGEANVSWEITEVEVSPFH